MNEDNIDLTVTVVSAYVSNNRLPVGDLPNLIAAVSGAFAGLSTASQPIDEKPLPAVNPKRSVFPDFTICLEDGKKFKSLKRHLGVHFDLTPAQYRSKWGLLTLPLRSNPD